MLSNLVKIYKLYSVLSKLHIEIGGDLCKVAVPSEGSESLFLVVDLGSGQIQLRSKSTVSIEGSFLFLNCEKEREEFIHQGRVNELEVAKVEADV